METSFNIAEIDDISRSRPIRFSVCTLVSNKAEYLEMVDSFFKAGFSKNETEFIYIDNTVRNKYDAFRGVNRFLNEALGKYIIICHQDILLSFDDIKVLEERISEIDQLDPSWAVLSNAGGIEYNHVGMKITHTDGITHCSKQFPVKAITVDENLIIVKRSANLAVSLDLKGFHLYGTDLCLIASILGYSIYIIEFNILHKSHGNINKDFYLIREELKNKYSNAFRSKYIQTTCTNFYITSSNFQNFVHKIPLVKFFVKRYYRKRRILKNL
ncbi:MAG TPA: hypothetical protein VF691_02260 [Cytophagaceae bacterium]|jgi:hypothetical protein